MVQSSQQWCRRVMEATVEGADGGKDSWCQATMAMAVEGARKWWQMACGGGRC